MVLLDSTAPNASAAPPTDTESYSLGRRVAVLVPAVAHLGAGRLANPFSYGTLPPRSRDEARANSSTARHLASWIEEVLAASASAHQASLLTDLDGKPLIVLTADTGNDAKGIGAGTSGQAVHQQRAPPRPRHHPPIAPRRRSRLCRSREGDP